MIRRLVAVATLVGTMFAVNVAPAPAADSTTTFTLTAAGGLSISAPASPDLGSAATDAGTLSAQMGATTVTDDRGLLSGSWTASVVSTDFTTGGATADETIAATNVRYWSGAATSTSGTATFTPGQALEVNKVAIDTSKTAFSATLIVGNNSATWNPTLEVTIPSDSVVGTYTGTVTHSVA